MHWTAESFSIEKYDAFVSDKRIPIYKVLYEDNHTESPPVGYQTLKQEKVHALCKRFESEGCRRNDYPVFVRLLKNKYVCLDGKHRLEAGKIFLRPDDQLWRALVFNSIVRIHHRSEHLLIIRQPQIPLFCTIYATHLSSFLQTVTETFIELYVTTNRPGMTGSRRLGRRRKQVGKAGSSVTSTSSDYQRRTARCLSTV